MNTKPDELGHGNSPAAWTSVIVMLVGISIGVFFLFLMNFTMVWIGVAILVLGIILGIVMKLAGYGVNGSKFQPKQHS